MSANPDSVPNQGDFSSRIPPTKDSQSGGHAVGTKIGNDAFHTFSAQVLPAGSAPAESTFQPNPISETPGQANNEDTLSSNDKESTYTSASDTIGGASSGDVHTGLGQPIAGQTAGEEKADRGSLIGVGASGAASGNQMTNGADDERQRGLDRETGNLAGKKDTLNDKSGDATNVTADELAAERD